MAYILERRPDEFGLVLDDNGFLRIKDLLKAITEEPGWGYVRKSHIHEVLATAGEAPFVIEQDKIRTVRLGCMAGSGEEAAPPKLLYHCVRRRAYPVVHKQGLRRSGNDPVFLAVSETMATRIGKRRDPEPVLLTVHAKKAFEAGKRFFKYGELMFTTPYLPADYLVGPPLPREKKKETPKQEKEPSAEQLAGSVVFDPDRSRALYSPGHRGKGSKKEIGWKEDVRRLRRRREKGEAGRGKT